LHAINDQQSKVKSIIPNHSIFFQKMILKNTANIEPALSKAIPGNVDGRNSSPGGIYPKPTNKTLPKLMLNTCIFELKWQFI
jgi:hypothetical protein